MTDNLRKIASFLFLLALVGTVSAGFGTATQTGTGKIVRTPDLPVFPPHSPIQYTCHIPLYKLPAYYFCIVGCETSGGGDSCPGRCEGPISVCTIEN